MTEYMTEYLIIVGGLCAAAVAAIAVERLRMRIYQRRLWLENLERELRWNESGEVEE